LICFCLAGLARAAESDQVEIVDFGFSPAEIVVREGTKLTFINNDRVPHSLIGEASGSEVFRSEEQMDSGDAFTVVVEKPGVITIRCGLHAKMQSKVTVTP
jgi:plastocyanin